MTLASIVIPCYNYEKYVAEAIKSALAQTYPNVEVIVIDDGSTDRSWEVIETFKSQVKCLSQPNGGSISAYNAGFKISTGQLIIFLDADDLLHVDAVSNCVKALTNSVAKIQFDLEIIDATGADLGRRFCNFPKDYTPASIVAEVQGFGTYIWPVTVGNAYARWFVDRFMPLSIAHGPDGLYNTVAPLYGDVITINRCLGSYRMHGKNQWNTSSDLKFSTRIDDRLRELDLLKSEASLRNFKLPIGNLLNYDLIFINYRIMAKKTGDYYTKAEDDTITSLLTRAMNVLYRRNMKMSIRIIHFFWFCLLAASPVFVARMLISFRYSRADIMKPLRDFITNANGKRDAQNR